MKFQQTTIEVTHKQLIEKIEDEIHSASMGEIEHIAQFLGMDVEWKDYNIFEYKVFDKDGK